MHKRSKVIYFILLCFFAFTATAGGVICVCDMSDKTDTHQNPVDKTSDNCHTDQERSSNESPNDCCPDMNLCGSGSTSIVSNALLIPAQTIHQAVQYPVNGLLVHNINSPPTPPPKLIY